MNKFTMVLTAAMLASGVPHCVAATTSNLDPGVLAAATASGATLTADEQGLFNGINALRQANGLRPLALDPALIEPARYQAMDLYKLEAGGYWAYLADGRTRISCPALAAEFGASAAGLTDGIFDNTLNVSDTIPMVGSAFQIDANGNLMGTNWYDPQNPNNLVSDWDGNDSDFDALLNNPALTRLGVGTLREAAPEPTALYVRGHFVTVPVPVIHWAVLAGTGSVSQPPVVTAPTPAPVPAPAAPTGLAATAGNGTAALTWNSVSGATSYNLYRATSSGQETQVATRLTTNSDTDSSLTDGTTYYYEVTAVGPGGESAKSNEAKATPQAAPPVVTTATVGSSTITGTTTTASVQASDPQGQPLTYTWSSASGVSFSGSSTNPTVTFSGAGAYTLNVVVKNTSGLTATAAIPVNVIPTLTKLAVAPGLASVTQGTATQYTASGTDQFGTAMATSPTWTTTGGGAISTSGSLADSSAGGPFTVTATIGKVTGTATITVIAPAPAPTPKPTPPTSPLTNLDPGVLAAATASGATLTADEQGLFNGINALRQANGLRPLALDPALIEPARYQAMDLYKLEAGGYWAYLADGRTRISCPALAAEFGASAAGLTDGIFDNTLNVSDTIPMVGSAFQIDANGNLMGTNWYDPQNPNNLVSDWDGNDSDFDALLNNPALTRLGVGTLREAAPEPTALYVRGHFVTVPVPVIHWAVLAGK